MRTVSLTIAALLLLTATLSAAEKPTLSRTLNLNFKRPGSILKVDGSGVEPISEVIKTNAYTLVLPKKVTLTLGIGGANPPKDRYHILVAIEDAEQRAGKIEHKLAPDRIVHVYWLAQYRYQFTFVRKNVSPQGRFMDAVVKLDVFAPPPK